MIKNSKSIVLLVLMIVLLVLISSRMSPRQTLRPSPTATDDPIPSETPPKETEAPGPALLGRRRTCAALSHDVERYRKRS